MGSLFLTTLVAAGLAWSPPAGWQPVPERLTSLGEPVHRLAAATFALRQDKPDRGCSPATARRQLPAGGALVFLLESREAAATPRDLAKLPPRPARFHVPPAGDFECLGHGAIIHWTEQGRAFQADVLLGRRAGAARRRQVEALLDSLTVQPIAPPPPPAGWRTIVSGAYDSMRVPPGWSARALARPRGTPRPRLLFRIANPAGTVVVRAVELRRGPGTPAGGLRVRGYRFRVRVHARLGATAQDLAWAQVSARSLGVSGVGRG